MSVPAWCLQPMHVCSYYRWSQPFAQTASILRLPICQTAIRLLLCLMTSCKGHGKCHGLAVDLGRTVALLEPQDLALCVGLALEMRCILSSSAQL